MGQRGGGAKFMPSKVVFPGGALDPEDRLLAEAMTGRFAVEALDARLWREADGDRDTGAPLAEAPTGPALGLSLALSAIRETFEETGLRLGRRADGAEDAAWAQAASDLPGDWRSFADLGGAPAAATPQAMGFIFRAITPPSLHRRFDARFFVAHAGDLMGDADDFSGASGELGALTWTPLSKAAEYDLPFITHLVIAELQSIAGLCAEAATPDDPDRGLSQVAALMRRRPVPFFRHSTDPKDGVAKPRFEAI